MKKTRNLLGLFLVVALFINSFQGKVYAQQDISETNINILINKDSLKPNKTPIIKNGRILVPLRSIFEAMGIAVEWDEINKTVTSVKEDTIVKIQINSDIAFINEEPIQIDQPAIIYKNSTYVPLRFVGESFGGNVVWNEDTRTAVIDTHFVVSPHIVEYNHMNIYVDKKKITTDLKPIKSGEVGMIPTETVFKAMGAKTYNDYVTGEIVAKRNDIELRIKISDKTVTVNGKIIQPVGKIIDYNDTIYIPAKLLDQAFNATVVWDEKLNEVNIYNKEASFVLPILQKEFIGGGVVPSNAPVPVSEGNTRLMVSDNPENLFEDTIVHDAATLWQDKVYEDEELIEHIVFGYHKNKFDTPVTIGITVENLSDENDIELVIPRGISRTSNRDWAIYDVGLKIAEQSISNKLPLIATNNLVVKSGNTLVIDDFYVTSGNLISFQHEFKVKKKSGTGKLNYIIRTVVSKNDEISLSLIKDEPLPLESQNRHPRGTWPFAKLVTELPTYEAGTYQTAYSISNGVTDNIFSAESSFGKEYGTISNIGQYGATYKIRIPVVNHTGSRKTIHVRLNPRGGRCAAAVKTEDGFFTTPEMNSEEATKVIEYVIEDGEEEILEFEMMNAGGSSLPIAVNIITVEE